MKEHYKIGYTTGVFDLFHIGHLNILRRAKEQCDYLIVGVSTDMLVEQYKHKKPVVPQDERFAIVQAIRYVDQVVWQETMDKKEAWKRLGFDVLFHGDDWKNSAMYNQYEEMFRDSPVSVVYLPHTKDVSSTFRCSQLKKEKNEK